MIVPVDPPGQPRARVISGRGKALLAQIAFQQVGKARTGLGFVEAQPVVLAKALVRQHQPIIRVVEREGIRHGLDRRRQIVLGLDGEAPLPEHEERDDAAGADDEQEDHGEQVVGVAHLALHPGNQPFLHLHGFARVAAELPGVAAHGLADCLDLPGGEAVFGDQLHLRLQIDQLAVERIEGDGRTVDLGDGAHGLGLLEQRDPAEQHLVGIDHGDRRAFRVERPVEVHGVDVTQQRGFDFADPPERGVVAPGLDILVVAIEFREGPEQQGKQKDQCAQRQGIALPTTPETERIIKARLTQIHLPRTIVA